VERPCGRDLTRTAVGGSIRGSGAGEPGAPGNRSNSQGREAPDPSLAREISRSGAGGPEIIRAKGWRLDPDAEGLHGLRRSACRAGRGRRETARRFRPDDAFADLNIADALSRVAEARLQGDCGRFLDDSPFPGRTLHESPQVPSVHGIHRDLETRANRGCPSTLGLVPLWVPLPPEVIREHPEKAVAVTGDEQCATYVASPAVRSRKAVRDQ